MSRSGIVIAAPKSGSGKTFVTVSLVQALKNRGIDVRTCKCGPDFIDPMFHRTVLGVSGVNLDTFFVGESGVKKLFEENVSPDAFAVVEGVMGLYDGLGGISEEASTYHVACAIDLPILLVINARGMGRSVLAEIEGFLSMDYEHRIKGMILNQASERVYSDLKTLIEEETGISVLGFVPMLPELQFKSRHLGLLLPNEEKDTKSRIQLAAEKLEETIDINQLLELGKCEPKIFSEESQELSTFREIEVSRVVGESGATDESYNAETSRKVEESYERSECQEVEVPGSPTLSVAYDEAFCFYYEENLKMLEDAGFRIKTFSPIHDDKLPDGTGALLIGGGYPELYAKELSQNEQMRQAIRTAIENGMPSLAECGGFLYLHNSISDVEGNDYSMVGAIDADCTYIGKLVRFGYVELAEKVPYFLPEGETIKGHEFHYCDSSDNGTDFYAKKPIGDKQWECMHVGPNHLWGFPHFYYPSNPHFVERFYQMVVSNSKKEWQN